MKKLKSKAKKTASKKVDKVIEDNPVRRCGSCGCCELLEDSQDYRDLCRCNDVSYYE